MANLGTCENVDVHLLAGIGRGGGLLEKTETVSDSPLVNIDYDESGALVGIAIEMPS